MTTAIPLRLRAITLAALAASALAWVALAKATVPMPMDAPLTMGVDVAVFLTLWLAMMFATMLPAVIPMVHAFVRVQEGREGGAGRVAVFVAAYFILWTAVGALAYAAAALVEAAAMSDPGLAERGPTASAIVLIVAGAYQLSPLKSLCLSGCRSPLGFLLAHWQDGTSGTLRMGLRHGAVCVGCCWLLFAAIFPVGMMNLAALALLTGLILVEKTAPGGQRVGQLAGVALLAYGVAALMDPSILPMTSTRM